MVKAAVKKDRKATKRKEKRMVPHGVAHIQATLQQHRSSPISDLEGNVARLVVGGQDGVQGVAQGHARSRPRWRRRTPATRPATRACGPSTSWCGVRAAAARGRSAPCSRRGIDVKSIKDVTPIPHNGCRPRKRRRV